MHLQGINHVVTLDLEDLEDLGDLAPDKGRVDSSHEDGTMGTTKGVQTPEKSSLFKRVGLALSSRKKEESRRRAKRVRQLLTAGS